MNRQVRRYVRRLRDIIDEREEQGEQGIITIYGDMESPPTDTDEEFINACKRYGLHARPIQSGYIPGWQIFRADQPKGCLLHWLIRFFWN